MLSSSPNKQLNPTVPMSPKGTFYFSNGTGRDSYIFHNNGGLCLQNDTKTAFALGHLLLRLVPTTSQLP